jgi:predicted TIM-barrel fold metal-dependent hydrolase
MMWHTFSQPLGIMAAAVSLTAGGVCERFPEIRFALLEGNCSWAPWLFYRLDEHYEWLGAMEAPDLTMRPSEYFLRNCFLSVEADETTVKQYVEHFGDDNLVFSTDYPHADSKFPNAVDAFCELPLPEASMKKILWDNWARLYAVEDSIVADRR